MAEKGERGKYLSIEGDLTEERENHGNINGWKGAPVI